MCITKEDTDFAISVMKKALQKLITNYYCRFVIVPHKRSLLLVCCRKGGHIRGGLLYFNFHDFNHQSIFFLVCKLPMCITKEDTDFAISVMKKALQNFKK
jgi:hypothetical protein